MSRSISIVIPTFREELIGEALEKLRHHLAALEAFSFELVVVDDTGDAARAAMQSSWPGREGDRVTLRVLPGPGQGKGAAVRHGILASTGELVFTMDADLPVALDQIEAFIAAADRGADVVVAERPMARNLRTPVRFVLSRGLYVFQRFIVFQAHVFDDTQCGFKLFRGELGRSLAERQATLGGMYDIELLYAAYVSGAQIARVPVIPNPELRPSKINVWRALRRDPVDLLRVKWRAMRGRLGPSG